MKIFLQDEPSVRTWSSKTREDKVEGNGGEEKHTSKK
jgi:hypothetical protein